MAHRVNTGSAKPRPSLPLVFTLGWPFEGRLRLRKARLIAGKPELTEQTEPSIEPFRLMAADASSQVQACPMRPK